MCIGVRSARSDACGWVTAPPWCDFFYALILTRTQASTAPVAIVNFIQYTGWE